MTLCRKDRCGIEELHEAHDDDFLPKRTAGAGTRPGLRANLLAKLRPPIVRTESRPDGPYAFVKCPECDGIGCVECQESGEMSLFRWHLWRRGC